MCGLAVDSLLKVCALRRTCDNITTVVIAFDNFFRVLQEYTNKGRMSAAESEIIEDITMEPVCAPYLKNILPSSRTVS
jgi:hypothetical protein